MSELARAEEAHRRGQWAEALAHADAGLRAPGEDRLPLLKLKTLSLFRLGRAEEAEALLGEVMVEGPDHAFMNEIAAAMAG